MKLSEKVTYSDTNICLLICIFIVA